MKKTRNTRQRGVILDLLHETREHPTAEKIYLDARRIIPNMSLGTVYRNLNFLQNQGLVREIRPFDGSSTRFDGVMSPHAHFHCKHCSSLFDVPLPQDFGQFQYNETDGISIIASVNLYIIGECTHCRPEDSSVTN